MVSAYFVNSLFEEERISEPRVHGKQLYFDESIGSPSGKPQAAIQSLAVSGPTALRGEA